MWVFLGEVGPPFRAEVAPVAYAWVIVSLGLTAPLVRERGTSHPVLGIITGACCVAAWQVAWQKGRDPVAWACVCFVTYGAGLVILLARRPARMKAGHFRACASCGELNRWKAEACTACGEPAGQAESSRRALDLSGAVHDAWLLGLFPWYGVIFGLAGIFSIPSGMDAGTMAGGCFTAAFWASAWGVPRRSTTAARITLSLVASAYVLTVVYLAPSYDADTSQLLLCAALLV